MSEKILLLWNEYASASDAHQSLRSQLESDSRVDVQSTDQDVIDSSAHDWPEQYAAVMIAGGDGTVHQIVNHLCAHNIDVPIGILPIGTGNDLARSLNLVSQPPDATFDQIINHPLTPVGVDLIELQLDDATVWSTNMVTAGDPAVLSGEISDEQKSKWGAFAYIAHALNVLSSESYFNIEYALDEQATKNEKVFSFFLANGPTCGGGNEISPRSLPTDGLLQLVNYLPMNTIDRAMLLTDYLTGQYEDHAAVHIESFNAVSMNSDKPIELSIDGERYQSRNIEAKVLPGRQKILVLPLSGSGSQ